MAEPTKRSLPLLWRLLREAGSPEELARWARDYTAPKRGAPRNTSLDGVDPRDGAVVEPHGFLHTIAEHHGPDWIMRTRDTPTRKGKLIRSQHAIVRYYVEELVQAEADGDQRKLDKVATRTEQSRDRNLPPAVRRAWDPKHLARSNRSAKRRSDHDTTERLIDSITRRLIIELRKRG